MLAHAILQVRRYPDIKVSSFFDNVNPPFAHGHPHKYFLPSIGQDFLRFTQDKLTKALAWTGDQNVKGGH